MGASHSNSHSRQRAPPPPKTTAYAVQKSGFKAIPDQYASLSEVQEALRRAGLESSNRKCNG